MYCLRTDYNGQDNAYTYLTKNNRRLLKMMSRLRNLRRSKNTRTLDIPEIDTHLDLSA